MKYLTAPLRTAGLLVSSLLLLVLAQTVWAQTATDGSENSESNAPATEPAPAPTPPRKQYIDPFSRMPLPDYSYTNRLPVPTRWRTLAVDPFSRTPLPPLVAPAPPKPPVEEESEPEFIPPIRVELPPGATVSRGSAPKAPRAFRGTLRPWEYAFSDDRWDFPPGATLRRR